ncbi:MAG TPA: PLD nuclease N-terminal domain-containing protein [Humidesulfovibrio sp.]|uniref:PLD nuclease N-terminal domain-containing protein n=1 Tax=Humidesulfovibrio sp. TaxID=2910988 RepID=UPI002CEBF557|nr:PLD nuclease N-terminal domain-containing protein [Humidesulfovibrio sp.]HWR04854.1 PLD nuclease N-terminal domain-containing protein [Humidesulfovibrio sp.]
MFELPPLAPSQWIAILGAVGLFVAISLYAIWDAFHRDFGSSNAKFGWIQLAVMVPFFGGLAYLIFGRKRGRKL